MGRVHSIGPEGTSSFRVNTVCLAAATFIVPSLLSLSRFFVCPLQCSLASRQSSSPLMPLLSISFFLLPLDFCCLLLLAGREPCEGEAQR
eukprot:2186865-Rhodomonas_salina.2